MNIKLLLVAIVFIASVRLFSFTLIDDRSFDYLELSIVIALIIHNLIDKRVVSTPFSFYIKAIIFLTLTSAIPAYAFHGQSFALSLLASRNIFFWLLYFSLHKIQVDHIKLEKMLWAFGLVWSLIMIIQHFSYPYVLFDVYHGFTYEGGEERAIDVRSGMIRIWIAGIGYSYFIATYIWYKLYEKFSLKHVILLSIVLGGILFMQSRQVIFGLLLVYVGDIIINFNANNIKRIRFTAIFVGLAILFFAVAGDFIFALIELSKDQEITSGDYIRAQEIEFFLFKYWPNPLCYLLGNGWEQDASPYGKEIKEQIKWGLGLYRSDVGLIGAFNKFGIIYVIMIIVLYIKVLIPSKSIFIPKYIRMYFVLCVLTSFSGSNFFESPSFFVPFICLFYIIDKANVQRICHNTYSQQVEVNSDRYQVAV